jgi:hypothetical protein
MAAPEVLPAAVLAQVEACSECQPERRPRMYVCGYHEGWWDGWDAHAETADPPKEHP